MVEGGIDKAEELFRRAERLSPRDSREWLPSAGLGYVYYMKEDFASAVAHCEKAVANNPRSATALRFLAASLAKAGQRAKAAEIIVEILRIEPHLTVSSLRARLANQPDAALERISASGQKT